MLFKACFSKNLDIEDLYRPNEEAMVVYKNGDFDQAKKLFQVLKKRLEELIEEDALRTAAQEEFIRLKKNEFNIPPSKELESLLETDVSQARKRLSEWKKTIEVSRLAEEKRKRELEEKRKRELEEKRRKALEEQKKRELEDSLYSETTPQNAVKKQQIWARKLEVDVAFTSQSYIEFVLIPAGTFIMGSKKEYDATPHQVSLSKPFYLGKYQVTQAQWMAVMGNNPSRFKGYTRPVEKVSWNDCQEFISSLNSNEETDKYRLPTEAEWEYACRAGTTTRFCFGDDKKMLSQYGCYWTWGGTHLVGQKKPNAWGLYDMHGNVAELCQDWYGDYSKSAVTDPVGCSPGSYRVSRGGSWCGAAKACTSAFRFRTRPEKRFKIAGFRLARDL